MRDAYENPWAHEREESRDALRYPMGPCQPGWHDMLPDGRGGGVCAYCGDTIDRSEL